MSDQPPWDQNIERQIPGLREAVSSLASVASNSGFRVATIVLTPDERRPEFTAPQTRIAFASETEAVPPTVATTTGAVERWAPAHPSGTHWHTAEEVPAPSETAREPGTEERDMPRRSKRASTSVVESESDVRAQFGKRKRFSEPPVGGQPSPSAGAFWGTVLEERPGTPQGMIPSHGGQLQPPPLVGPSQPRADLPRSLSPRQETLRRRQTGLGIEQGEEDRVQRTSTFPALRFRSPIGHRQRQPMLPSLQEPLFGTPARAFPDRVTRSPAPREPRRQPPQRRFFRRTASHILGRLSPFGAPGPSVSRVPLSPPPLNSESQFYAGRAAALPAMQGPIQRPAAELFSQPGAGDAPHTHLFPAVQRSPQHDFPSVQVSPQHGVLGQYGTNVTQHSGSRSASGSGVSHVQPPGASASPAAEGSEIQRVAVSSRGKRGRRLGTSHERDQVFACEICGTTFKRKSDKNRHVRVVHEKSRPFKCPLCPKTFGEKSNMLKHRASVHDDVRTFRCPYCDTSFPQRGLCDTHVRNVHDKKQAKYFCEHCGLPFSRKVQLNDHYEQAHPEFMATYGHYYAGSSSTAPAMATAAAPAREPARDDRTLVGDTIQPVESQAPAAGTFPTFAGSGPAEGTTTPPPVSQYPLPLPPLPPQAERHESEEDSGRRRSFQGDSSG